MANTAPPGNGASLSAHSSIVKFAIALLMATNLGSATDAQHSPRCAGGVGHGKPPAGVVSGSKASTEASITTTWDSRPIDHIPANLTLTGRGDHVEITVSAPFFNDARPPCTAEGACDGLWDYEVVEAFFLAPDDKYIEIELGPWGQHLVLLLNGERNAIAKELQLEYEVTSREEGGLWTGTAKIPAGYFPPNVEKWNAYAIHNDAASPTGDGRVYESLHPVPEGMFPQPDFHRLNYFGPIDFGNLLPTNPNSDLSEVWLEALGGRQ